MTITNKVSLKSVNGGNTPIADVVDAPTIGTATAGAELATVAYTAAATGGAATSFTAISTPGSITGTGSSPITVTGLTGGTAYTFKVYGTNAAGVWTATQSQASNSVTPAVATSFESIATATVGAGGQSSVEFTSIPSTYTHLQIRMVARYTSTENSGKPVYMQFNSDTGANYFYHRLQGYANLSETGISAGDGTNVSFIRIGYTTGTATPNSYSAHVVDLLDYANTNKNKTIRNLSGWEINDNSGYRAVGIDSGAWNSTSAVTSIKIYPSDNSWAQYSSFALYGIKG